jgi:uncharacterized protein DUF4252
MNRTRFLAASTAAATLFLAGLALPVTGNAAGPELRIPDFSHLHARARDSVDFTLDGFLLRLAKHFAAEDGGDEAQILQDIKSVRVRNYEFDSDDAYSRADVDSVRKQLNGPGWSALATVHHREPREDVDVFLNTDNGKILGIAVIASEARSFTIVNIVGNIDLDKLARISGDLGIPKVSTED